ncbi:hypothetical protein [Paraburkholderia unamae]|uniref:hypothetical protein n=1 Tax=Paraburkholderia unamae TaxID=219649 RepID=UPI0011BE337F|nr:hypothetical protein [Paraburkholderia unamae]
MKACPSFPRAWMRETHDYKGKNPREPSFWCRARAKPAPTWRFVRFLLSSRVYLTHIALIRTDACFGSSDASHNQSGFQGMVKRRVGLADDHPIIMDALESALVGSGE